MFFLWAVVMPCRSLAAEMPEGYGCRIVAADFFPTGAKFTFEAEPESNGGKFEICIPGAFDVKSVRLAGSPENPENVYGDISASVLTRTSWTPPSLAALKHEAVEQSKRVSALNSRKSSLEQTLSLLKNPNFEKADPEKFLNFIMKAQDLRKETEEELSSLKLLLSEEQEKLNMLNSELQSKLPRGQDKFIVITGKAKGKVLIEAFTRYASWKPRYILNLSSSTGNTEAQMLITVSQRTGLDYAGKVTFHTKTPDEKVNEPSLQPLKVGIKPKLETVVSTRNLKVSRTNRMFESARAAAPAPEMYMDTAVLEDDDEIEEPEAPKVSESLSDRTIEIICPDDKKLLGTGEEIDYSAADGKINLAGKLELILIPEQRNDAWIIASMDEGNEHLLPAEAELRVDNHPSGKIFIGEFGTSQRRIPFGYANQITVKKEALIGKTGVSWFSGVFTSGYKLEITNGTKYEQVITVRDRLPVPTDEKIKLDVKRIEPKEKERDKENRLTWQITVPAGATVPVIVDFTLSYPSGEELEYR